MPIARTDPDIDHISQSSQSPPIPRLKSPSPHDLRPSSRRRVPRHVSPHNQETMTARFSGRISPTETRQELIDRVKRDQRATWLNNGGSVIAQTAPQHSSAELQASDGAPAAASEPPKEGISGPGNLEAAMTIERPRSALHRGDFREPDAQAQAVWPQPDSPRPTRNPWLERQSPSTPWSSEVEPRSRDPPRLRAEQTVAALQSITADTLPIPIQPRARAASYTARPPSFILRPPTSPLVNETQHSDSERDESLTRRGRKTSPNKTSRRRTFSPTYLKSIRQQPFSSDVSSLGRPHVKRENSFPYQAHQPRRSISSITEQDTAPSTPSARSRRPSMASETSPLQRLPMIGRYEESILRGRMSSLPSRPFDFVAQIGVLGKGKCKPSLRCPPHVTIPFPAVFYHYGSRPGSPTSSVSDGPSPYVGMVDLDTNLKIDERASRRSIRSNGSVSTKAAKLDRPHRIRTKDAVEHPLPKGGYRIPEQGQLQIIIKNPNKTAVKLFLVPYDLSGMTPGEKTFIRQRSYSAGPILDMPLSARKNFGTDRPEAALSNSEDPKERPVLRYLIHLNICCPAKGRHYLYKSIRVVFANRVPDGKEKLRQEIQVPEPRYSLWKPEKEAVPPSPLGDSFSRFSYGESSSRGFEEQTGRNIGDKINSMQTRNFTFPLHTAQVSRPPSRQPCDADGDVSMANTVNDPESPAGSPHHPALMDSPTFRPSSRHTFERLTRAEYTGPGARERTQSPHPGHGLLTMQLQLRDLEEGRSADVDLQNVVSPSRDYE